MAIKTEFSSGPLLILRNLINDEDQEFTDERLQDVFYVAAYQVNTELNFGYIVNLNEYEISPDFSNDTDFIYLSTLKSACIIDRGAARLAAAIDGMEAKCGPAVLKVNRKSDIHSLLLNSGYCASYEEAKRQYAIGNAGFIQAILSPFVNSNYLP